MTNKVIVTPFRKSTYSGGDPSHECVEVAHTADGGRAVRDSKDPAKGTQHFGAAAWGVFVRRLAVGP